MRTLSSSFVAALVCGPVLAQMSGTYRVDPGDPNAFADVNAAVAALVVQGVSGAVDIAIASGSYVESIVIPPIVGAGPASTITFRRENGPVTLQGDVGDAVALLAAPGLRNRSLVFDGLTFSGAPGHAISATSYVEDIEIRNCRFDGTFVGMAPLQTMQSVIRSDNFGDEIGWRVHHNHFAAATTGFYTSIGIEMHHAGGWEIHHNAFDLDDDHHAIYMSNNSSRVDRIYDNLFFGAVATNNSNTASAVSVIKADAANYENWITHNTFAIEFSSSGTPGCCIASGGTVVGGMTVQNHVFGNVFDLRGNGYAIGLNMSGFGQNPIQADGNVYFGPNSSLFRIGNATGNGMTLALAAWQTSTGSDALSTFVDPQLQAPFAATPDLRPTPASPIAGVAVATPAYVVDDFAGRLRDAMPDAGAYETTSAVVFGSGCPGTGQLVPAIGSSGPLAVGSPTFALELTQAAGASLTLLVGGASRQNWQQLPLPLDLGGGCELLVSLDSSALFATSFAGAVTAALPIPNQPQLFGGDLFFQWAVLDPASGSGFGVAMSDAIALQL